MHDGQSYKNTNGITIEVDSEYLPSHSRPHEKLWFYIYHVHIENQRTDVVQLLSRHWVITNAEGEEENVRGEGVVGEQPILAPGEHFEYTSACPLNTPFGTMHGTYFFTSKEDSSSFEASITPFFLSETGTAN